MQRRILILLLSLAVIAGLNQTIYANSNLPASNWYAVIWNRSADTLHWVNNATELASMPRPQMPGEMMGTDLYISPNGRWMMMTALLDNQQQGIGFYDLQTSLWIQTHEAQPGETIIAAERNPFTHNSEYAAIGLHSDTGWRVITFETATGNARDVLTNEHPDIVPNLLPPQAVPRVTLYSLDEGMAQWRVHVRFVTLGPNQGATQQPSLGWYPQQDIVYVDSFHPLLLDLDILPIQNRVLYSLRDDNDPTQTRIFQQTLGHSGEVAFQQSGVFVNQPRWIAGGQFVAYRLTQGAQVPMWYLGGVGSADLIPFGPNYDELLGTVDGFVLVDYEGGEVKFANTLAFEAFSPTVGNVIYTTDTSNFHIAYITPMGSEFTLQSLATPSDDPVVVDGADEIQAPPPTCGTAPAPRLTVGQPARVTFTDGTPLNIRTAAAGEFIMQIPEGTVINIVGGPICADNFFWWNLQFESQGATIGGWAAEGSSDDYYLEPLAPEPMSPTLQAVTAQPTNTPPLVLQAVTPQPTATPQMVVITPLAVQPTQAALVVAPPINATWPPVSTSEVQAPQPFTCPGALPSNLMVGMQVVTQNLGGTLAMRTNLDDPYPSHQIPLGQLMTIQEGPECRNAAVMWRVSTTLNSQPVIGWVAEGFGNTYYLGKP